MGHDKLRRFRENLTFPCLLQPDANQLIIKPGAAPASSLAVPSGQAEHFGEACLPVRPAGGDCQAEQSGEACLSARPAEGNGLAEQSGGLRLRDHQMKGRWNGSMFSQQQPIVLELGCGKGEYTIDLSRRNPARNYVGVDIKGARLWKGAKYAMENQLPNVAFLRTRVEFITALFAPGEVSGIWLTFSDPQMKSENSRLTSPVFLERYRSVLKPGGVINLKTDSIFLYQYTLAVCKANNLDILASTPDLYSLRDEGGSPFPKLPSDDVAALFQVQTFYEKMFLRQGYKITYLAFTIDHEGPYAYPEFDEGYWRGIDPPRVLDF